MDNIWATYLRLGNAIESTKLGWASMHLRSHVFFVFVATSFLLGPVSAGGLLGDAIEGLCGNCGAGQALDDAHENLAIHLMFLVGLYERLP